MRPLLLLQMPDKMPPVLGNAFEFYQHGTDEDEAGTCKVVWFKIRVEVEPREENTSDNAKIEEESDRAHGESLECFVEHQELEESRGKSVPDERNDEVDGERFQFLKERMRKERRKEEEERDRRTGAAENRDF